VTQLAKAKKDQLWQQKDAEARTRKAWEAAANAIRDALATMNSSPKVAGEQIRRVSADTAATVAQGKEVFFQLVANADTAGAQFHALNTMVLSVMVGKKAGLSQTQLADLAMAALAHDAGKSEVPQHILKNAQRKKHEEDFYRQHVHHSVQLATLAGSFSASALAMIADHHETLDGNGWPHKKSDLSAGARILALVNRYERLCSPEAPAREAMTPAEALAQLFRQESGKYDAGLLSILVKLLGVYPPGTVVQLSDESLALVIAPGPNSLQPKVLIYRPELPKDEAPMLSLATQPELKILSAVRPGKLEPEVLAWLDPQQRLAYFFNAADA
jgi:HD-GYP domain-containing protein (c-di-GMP phosphodiesterase class II)